VSDKPSLFAELKRRNVYKVVAAYAVVAWLLIQAASIILPTFEAPAWTMKVLIAILAIGFPIAVVLAWAFEITPEGIVRAEDVPPNQSITRRTGRKLIGVTVVLAFIATALLVFKLVGTARWAVRSDSDDGSGRSRTAALPIPDKSIAVLPFENLSDEKSNAYFAEGVQDEILTRLAKVADLKVISRTSTQHFKSTPENLPEIAKQLGVANILEGSVQKSNDQVRVNVQLINALTDAHLWADIYDRKLTDIFAVESDIAKTIAETLQARLTGSEKRALSARPTENPEAYQLYLKARFFWNKRTAADLRKSIDYFNQATEKDPNYALAYAGSAQAWLLLPGYSGGTPQDCFPQAETAAKKALSLDDNSADAHAALGMVKQLFDFDSPGAIAEFERAIKLDPNDATAHHWFANHSLSATGQINREISEMKRALELDPLSFIINTNLGQAYIYANRFDEAIAQLRRTVEMDSGFYFAHYILGQALELNGQLPEAMAEYQKAITLNDDPFSKALLGHLYGKMGRKDEARQILEELRQTREQRYFEAYGLAIIYLGLGNRDEALNWLEQGYRDRDGFNMGVIRVDQFLDPLHGDPRFEALAEKIVPARVFAKPASPAK
jgi:TolB-like protein/Flp pilus assembly protein TadD